MVVGLIMLLYTNHSTKVVKESAETYSILGQILRNDAHDQTNSIVQGERIAERMIPELPKLSLGYGVFREGNGLTWVPATTSGRRTHQKGIEPMRLHDDEPLVFRWLDGPTAGKLFVCILQLVNTHAHTYTPVPARPPARPPPHYRHRAHAHVHTC